MPEKLLDFYIQERDELKSKNQAIVITVSNQQRMTLHEFIQENSAQFELEPELRDLFSIIDSYKKAEDEAEAKKVNC